MQAFITKIQQMQSPIAQAFNRKVSESNLELAIEWMKQQYEQKPSIKHAHFYAFLLIELEKWEESIQFAAKILSENPQDIDMIQYLGLALLMQDQIDDAYIILKRGLELAPKNEGLILLMKEIEHLILRQQESNASFNEISDDLDQTTSEAQDILVTLNVREVFNEISNLKENQKNLQDQDTAFNQDHQDHQDHQDPYDHILSEATQHQLPSLEDLQIHEKATEISSRFAEQLAYQLADRIQEDSQDISTQIFIVNAQVSIQPNTTDDEGQTEVDWTAESRDIQFFSDLMTEGQSINDTQKTRKHVDDDEIYSLNTLLSDSSSSEFGDLLTNPPSLTNDDFDEFALSQIEVLSEKLKPSSQQKKQTISPFAKIQKTLHPKPLAPQNPMIASAQKVIIPQIPNHQPSSIIIQPLPSQTLQQPLSTPPPFSTPNLTTPPPFKKTVGPLNPSVPTPLAPTPTVPTPPSIFIAQSPQIHSSVPIMPQSQAMIYQNPFTSPYADSLPNQPISAQNVHAHFQPKEEPDIITPQNLQNPHANKSQIQTLRNEQAHSPKSNPLNVRFLTKNEEAVENSPAEIQSKRMAVHVKAKKTQYLKVMIISLSFFMLLGLWIFLEKLNFELRVKSLKHQFESMVDFKEFQAKIHQDWAYQLPQIYQWLDSNSHSDLMILLKMSYLLKDENISFDQILTLDQYINKKSNIIENSYDFTLLKVLELRQQKQFKPALELISQRKDAFSIGLKAMIQMDLGFLKEACDDFNQALTLNPYLTIFQIKKIECISWHLGPKSVEIILNMIESQKILSHEIIEHLRGLHLITLSSDENQIIQALDQVLKSNEFSKREKDLAIANMIDWFLIKQLPSEKIQYYLNLGLKNQPNHPKLLVQQVRFEIISLRLKKANDLLSMLPDGLQSMILPLIWLAMGQIEQWEKAKNQSPSKVLSNLSDLQTSLLNVQLSKNEGQMIDLFDKKFLLSKNNLENVILLSAVCQSNLPNAVAKAKKACLDLKNLLPNHLIFSQRSQSF